MKNSVTTSLLFFFLKMPKIWVGLTTVKGEKKEDGLMQKNKFHLIDFMLYMYLILIASGLGCWKWPTVSQIVYLKSFLGIVILLPLRPASLTHRNPQLEKTIG